MAQNIFTEADYYSIVLRINRLTAQSQRRWGKMNLAQMLEHCAVQLKLGLGILPVTKTEGIFLYRTAPGRWLSLFVIPWPNGFQTPSAMNMLTNHMPVASFDEEKVQLLTLLQQVIQKQSLARHPFYGPLNKKDWGRLIWVHLDHHLRQFSQ